MLTGLDYRLCMIQTLLFELREQSWKAWYCDQYNTQKWKSDKKMGKAWEILWCEWRQVEVRWMLEGRGPHSNNIPDFITTPWQNPSHSWYRVLDLIGEKLTSRFIVHKIWSWALPPTSTFRPHHMISVPRYSPFFATLLLWCIFYTECKPKEEKIGEAWEVPDYW